MSTQVIFESDSKSFSADRTVSEILSELLPAERQPNAEIFMKARKLRRDQKLSETPGFSSHSVFRVRERKTTDDTPTLSTDALRAKVVELEQRTQNYTAYEERILLDVMWKKDYIQELLKAHPIIQEEPVLVNVMTDLSLMYAILGEESGFIQQHPKLIQVLIKFLDDVLPNAMHTMLSNTNPAVFRDAARFARAGGAGGAPAVPRNAGPAAITPEMLQQALMAFGNAAAGPSAPGAPAPAPAPAVVDPLTAARVEYSAQLTQLADYGFTDETENLQVLNSVGGDIAAAIDLLMVMRHGSD
uniref:UBA domain-containing protein n=1 Tax=Panagrellus redivivus TaxID=6233 RepID=A0A7E4VTJ5_PANRE